MSQSQHKLLFTNCFPFGNDSCDAVYIEDGTIREIGDSSTLAAKYNTVQVTDLSGALLLPGLGDAHMHMAVGGKSLSVTNLAGLNLEQSLEKLQAANDESDNGWIVAFNWNRSRYHLDLDKLDMVKTELPIVVHAVDLHSCCCNSIALKRAGIDSTTPNPENGKIIRDVRGNPNGNLMESASSMVSSLVPPPSSDQWRNHILEAQDYLLSLGLTSVSEVLQPELEELFWELDREGKLILNIDGWRRTEVWNGAPPPPIGGRFKVRTLKLFLDGAFGSRTAALNEPYCDDPSESGLLFFDDDKLLKKLTPAVEAGWKLAIHALGDKAVSQACRVLEQLPRLTDNGCHRIEHAQFISEDGVNELINSNAVISIQPVHLPDDREWIPDRLGAERCKRTFVWNSIVEAGGRIVLGSDWPVASPDPLLNLHIAINRCGFGQERDSTFESREALSPTEAIRAMTEGWAVAAGIPQHYGTLKVGSIADLTAVSGFDRNLRDWSKAVVDMTVCRGRIVFSR